MGSDPGTGQVDPDVGTVAAQGRDPQADPCGEPVLQPSRHGHHPPGHSGAVRRPQQTECLGRRMLRGVPATPDPPTPPPRAWRSMLKYQLPCLRPLSRGHLPRRNTRPVEGSTRSGGRGSPRRDCPADVAVVRAQRKYPTRRRSAAASPMTSPTAMPTSHTRSLITQGSTKPGAVPADAEVGGRGQGAVGAVGAVGVDMVVLSDFETTLRRRSSSQEPGQLDRGVVGAQYKAAWGPVCPGGAADGGAADGSLSGPVHGAGCARL
jgi:hypothetical protein